MDLGESGAHKFSVSSESKVRNKSQVNSAEVAETAENAETIVFS